VELDQTPESGARLSVLERVRRHLPEIGAVYFAEDTPLVYFSVQDHHSPQTLADLHRHVWKDSRVPLLFAIDRSQIRVYDAWATPRSDSPIDEDPTRIIKCLQSTARALQGFDALKRIQLETGAFMKSHPQRFRTSGRCDLTLLENLEHVYSALVSASVPQEIAHRLLLRSILLLHLEHREVLGEDFLHRFCPDASSITEVYASRDSTYELFQQLSKSLNGDLIPVLPQEAAITDKQTQLLASFLRGEVHLKSRHLALWPLYDFSILPVQVISSVYERLLHSADNDAARESGAHYTPHSLVELMLDEVLPWPGPRSRAWHKQLPRIVDPSCGSGVFLVEAFRRLVAYWRRDNPGKEPTHRELAEIMCTYIHGSDTNQLAISVAAFSLYLSLLDEFGGRLKSLDSDFSFPRLSQSGNRVRPNLVCGDAFDEATFAGQEYDLVIGNPPWKREALPKNVKSWCEQRGLAVAGERAHPFMWLSTALAPNGQVAILTPSKWLLNRQKPDAAFRRQYLTNTHIRAVVNLSALRHHLFASAIGPATAVVLDSRRPERPSDGIMYCTPRGSRPGHSLDSILLDAADIKWLPRSEAERSDDVWKVLFVGGWRDLRLLRRLLAGKSLQQLIHENKRNGWISARGFQPMGKRGCAKDSQVECPELLELPYLDSGRIDWQVVPPASTLRPWDGRLFCWTGPLEIYLSPHVLFRKGMGRHGMRVAFSDYDCSFPDAVTAVKAPPADAERLKALALYLGSDLATYMLYLSLSTWGVGRPTANKSEVLSLPAFPLERPKIVHELSSLHDEYIPLLSDDAARKLLRATNAVLSSAFGLNRDERILVSDMITECSDVSRLAMRTSIRELRSYAATLRNVLERVLAETDYRVAASVYRTPTPLSLAVLDLRTDDRGPAVAVGDIVEGREILQRLDAALTERRGQSLYRRRHMKIYDNSAVYILKPNERKNWTRSQALHDADEIIAETLSSSTACP